MKTFTSYANQHGIYQRSVSDVLDSIVNQRPPVSEDESLWAIAIVALCGRNQLALALLNRLLIPNTKLPEDLRNALADWKAFCYGKPPLATAFFQALNGFPLNTTVQTVRKATIDWQASTDAQLLFNLTCPACGHVFRIAAQSDFMTLSELHCLKCFQAVHFDLNHAVTVAKSTFLKQLRRTELTVLQNKFEARDALAHLLTNARRLEHITPVRFVFLFGQRIGHFAINTEILLLKQKYIYNEPNAIYVCFARQPTSNTFMQEMWARILDFSPLAETCFRICKNSPGLKAMAIDAYSECEPKGDSSMDINCLLDKTKPQLSFNSNDHKRAKTFLAKMGMKGDSEYVCFLGRDPQYMKKWSPGNDWSYHDYRNMPVGDFLPAMSFLAEKGIYCLRMGHIIAQPLQTENPRIIDYATLYRNEFMDIYLSGNTQLFVSSGTGIDAVTSIFRRPVCFVNLLPAGYTPCSSKHVTIIHKKLLIKSEQRFLSYSEQLENGSAWYVRSSEYEEAGITVVNNTPQEIQEAVMEAWQRAKGEWVETDSDRELHDKAISILRSGDRFNYASFNARIGLAYLKSNPYLLE